MISAEYIKILTHFFADIVKFAFLFGSANNKFFTKKSDIDIAVWLKEYPVSANKIIELKYQAEKTISFDFDIDIVVMNNADIIITNQILTKGKIIINNNSTFTNNYINYQRSLYLDFKFFRKNLEENLKTTIL